MHAYDDEVLEIFLEKQLQLFDEEVATDLDEASDFLEECMAEVLDSFDDVVEYFEESGFDTEGMTPEEIEDQSEVFKLPDGRYLIVEA